MGSLFYTVFLVLTSLVVVGLFAWVLEQALRRWGAVLAHQIRTNLSLTRWGQWKTWKRVGGCLSLLVFLGAFFQTRRMVFGVLAYGLSLILIQRLLFVLRHAWALRAEEASIPFFHAVGGLTLAGYAFPVALREVGRHPGNPFAETLLPFLERLDQGHGFSLLLRRFDSRSGLSRVGRFLRALDQAYRSGLSTEPLFRDFLPLWERELAVESQQRTLLRGAVFQAIFAGSVPWILLWMMNVQGGVVTNFVDKPFGKAVLVGAFLWEILGLLFIRKLCRF